MTVLLVVSYAFAPIQIVEGKAEALESSLLLLLYCIPCIEEYGAPGTTEIGILT